MTNTTTKPTWHIILGYGRSGSTWLELQLAEKNQARNLGEFFLLKDADAHCSCQKTIENCSHWTGYSALNAQQRIAKLTPQNYNDSSKSAHGAISHLIALARNRNYNIQATICFRHPIRVLRSGAKGSNRLLRKGIKQQDSSHWLRLLITWPLAYLIAGLFCLASRSKPRWVNFDDSDSVQGFLSSIDIANSKVQQEHIVEGNRLLDGPIAPWKAPEKIAPWTIKERLVFFALYPGYRILILLERCHA